MSEWKQDKLPSCLHCLMSTILLTQGRLINNVQRWLKCFAATIANILSQMVLSRTCQHTLWLGKSAADLGSGQIIFAWEPWLIKKDL